MQLEESAVVITKTPFRMSFFGGGTDFAPFYEKHGGSVISSTFDKYCYVSVRHLPPYFNYRNEIVYSKTERVNDVERIEHPAVRNAMKFLDMHDLRLTYDADLPARSGLGTSSSFAVGMLDAFYALKGKYRSKEQLAKDAIYLERVLCAEEGGEQDQIAAAYGGLNRIDFSASGFSVRPIILSAERKAALDENLLLYFTGFSRFSFEVQKKHEIALKTKEAQLVELLSLVDDAEKILVGKGSLDEFGTLLDYTWKLKRGINSSVSTDAIDAFYAKAMAAGARGGKLLGAGGGGFLLLYVDDEHKASVRSAMTDLMEVSFHFENNGSTILYYSPEDYKKDEVQA
jgi:D-glycero-alpha-D-manno-heptose-7-phosphate kinase